MADLAGIIYPQSLSPGRALDRALRPPEVSQLKPHSITHKNLQCGTIEGEVFAGVDSPVHCMIDGTIHNLPALRKELQFPEDCSAAETVAALFARDGSDCLIRIEGEFVLVLYHLQEGCLYLVRDRLGRKPLYWYHQRSFFVFSSQIKGLLRTGLVPAAPARDGMAAFLFFGFIPQDMTALSHINRLLPSHYLKVSLDGKLSIRSYWSYSSYHQLQLQEGASPLNSVLQRFQEAVESRLAMHSGRPACIWDGSRGAALMTAAVNQWSPRKPDIYLTNQKAQHPLLDTLRDQGCIVHSAPLKGEDIASYLPQLIWNLDEPLASPSVFTQRRITQEIAQEGGALMSMVGADSLLGPPPPQKVLRSDWRLSGLLNYLPESLFLGLCVPCVRVFSRNAAYGLLRRYYRTPLHSHYLRARALFIEQEIKELAPLLGPAFDADVFLHKFYHLARVSDEKLEIMYFEAKTRLPDHYLHSLRQICGASKVPWESPLLDNALVQAVARLSPQQRYGSTPDSALVVKLVRHLLHLEKGSPLPHRPRWEDPPPTSLLASLTPRLMDGELIHAGLLSRSGLRRLLQRAHAQGRYWNQLWALLMLEGYYRIFIAQPMSSRPPEMSILELLDT